MFLISLACQMFRHYGVEAGRDTIIKEVKTVFGVYGIDVNFRHLSLVADYMVRGPQGTGREGVEAGRKEEVSAAPLTCFQFSIVF